MPTGNVSRFASLLVAGFEAVGCRIPVACDEGCVIVRDVVVEIGPSIACFRVADPEAPFMSFPADATQSAASAVCVAVLSGMVTRAIESAGNVNFPKD